MKKQVVFVYDLESRKLIEVNDVKDLTPQQFIDFSNQAEKNLRTKLEELKQKELAKQAEIDGLQNQINDLRLLILHLLGINNLEEEKINELLRIESEEQENE